MYLDSISGHRSDATDYYSVNHLIFDSLPLSLEISLLSDAWFLH